MKKANNKIMKSDYWKCVSIINSCETKEQLKSCDRLNKNFERKHRNTNTSWFRWQELNKLTHTKLMAL